MKNRLCKDGLFHKNTLAPGRKHFSSNTKDFFGSCLAPSAVLQLWWPQSRKCPCIEYISLEFFGSVPETIHNKSNCAKSVHDQGL